MCGVAFWHECLLVRKYDNVALKNSAKPRLRARRFQLAAAPWRLSVGLATPLPSFFPENEPNFSFRINKTVQKRTQNEPKRTQLSKVLDPGWHPDGKKLQNSRNEPEMPFRINEQLFGGSRRLAVRDSPAAQGEQLCALVPPRAIYFSLCSPHAAYWLLPNRCWPGPPSPLFFGKTNPTSPLESTKRCKNAPKTNPTFEGIRPRPPHTFRTYAAPCRWMGQAGAGRPSAYPLRVWSAAASTLQYGAQPC